MTDEQERNDEMCIQCVPKVDGHVSLEDDGS